jgi:hypothetical protein
MTRWSLLSGTPSIVGRISRWNADRSVSLPSAAPTREALASAAQSRRRADAQPHRRGSRHARRPSWRRWRADRCSGTPRRTAHVGSEVGTGRSRRDRVEEQAVRNACKMGGRKRSISTRCTRIETRSATQTSDAWFVMRQFFIRGRRLGTPMGSKRFQRDLLIQGASKIDSALCSQRLLRIPVVLRAITTASAGRSCRSRLGRKRRGAPRTSPEHVPREVFGSCS